MGDTYRDPIDHFRATRPLAGESLIDVLHWPGYIMVLAGVFGVVGSLAAFGTGHDHEGTAAAVAAVVVTVIGWRGWRPNTVGYEGSPTAGTPSIPKFLNSDPVAEKTAVCT